MAQPDPTAIIPAAAPQRRLTAGRVFDVIVGALLLVIAAPLMLVLAVAIRAGSHGPVLRRERTHHRGRPVEVRSFRTTIDGAATATHRRVRNAVGIDTLPVTRVGAFMHATRTHRLPRLFDVIAGHASLL